MWGSQDRKTDRRSPGIGALLTASIAAVGILVGPAPASAKAPRDIPLISIPKTFSQKDRRWARDRVGGSNETLRKVGCVVTSVAMLFNYFGVKTDPKRLNKYLRDTNGYNKRGWLSWLHAQKMTGGKAKLTYNGTFNRALLDRTLQRKIPVIIKTRSVRNSIHWMLVVGKRKGQYLVHDPLHRHGRAVRFKRVAKKIYQMRIYSGAPKTAAR